MEECFFFGNLAYKLFGCLHNPDEYAKQNHIGIVICSPFGEEKLWSHRVVVNFARYLAARGFSALRFDYMGNGDSDGDFEDVDIETQISDIKCAASILKQKCEVHKVGLLGLRLGATLIALCEEENVSSDFMVLWEPIVKVGSYLRGCLRSNLTTQMAAYKEIKYTRDQMIHDLLSGRSVNVNGYLMSSKFFKQGSLIDISKMNLAYPNPVSIVHITKGDTVKASKSIRELYQKYSLLNASSELEIIKEEPFWSDVKIYYQRAESLFSSTLMFLKHFEV